LVLHGLEDQLIPPKNGHILADNIPHAQLVELENASHWLHSEQPQRCALEITNFVRSIENRTNS
jgi:pimeloyl-ACP methyl ester carboxylesterase